jgi:uncharacterized protein (DUF2267 family)
VHTFERLLTAVRIGAELDRTAAERTVRAALTPLLERLSGGQADDLARELRAPEGVVPGTGTLRNRPADAFDSAGFLHRVAEREGSDEPTARRHAVVVLQALQLVAPPRETRDAADQLPGDFADLLSAPWRPRLPLSAGRDLVELVTDRSGLTAEQAGRVIEAVLEALAERLPDAEVDALAEQLPADLHPALQRGRVQRTAPRGLTVDALVELLAERVESGPERAREHAHAVLPALVAALDDRLLADLLVQLPDDFADLVSPAVRG